MNFDIDCFSKLPNKLLLPSEEDKSILQIVKDDKVILVLDYLYINTNRINQSIFTINDIVTTYGYKINLNKGRINDRIKNILIYLQELNIIQCEANISNIKYNEMIKCTININYDNNFVILTRHELKTILDYNLNNIDNIMLLKLYCYLKCRIYRRQDNKGIAVTGGKAEACYPSYDKIFNDIGVSEGIIHKYIDILQYLKLIVYDNAGVYYHKDNVTIKRESPNTYVLYDEKGFYKQELRECIKFFKNTMKDKGFIFVSKGKKKYKNNNRKLNGELGALIKLSNQGRATIDHLMRIDEIKDLIGKGE